MTPESDSAKLFRAPPAEDDAPRPTSEVGADEEARRIMRDPFTPAPAPDRAERTRPEHDDER